MSDKRTNGKHKSAASHYGKVGRKARFIKTSNPAERKKLTKKVRQLEESISCKVIPR